MNILQTGSLLNIDTPLGSNVFMLVGLHGVERVSAPFNFDLGLITTYNNIAVSQLIGKPVTVRVALRDSTLKERYIHGHLDKVSLTHSDAGHFRYEAKLVPWIAFLKQTCRSRVYKGTPKDILSEIFDESALGTYKFDLTAAYEKIEYCVQHQESDFTFMSRLMEHFGIFYFFSHEKDRHTLICADDSSVHKRCPGQNTATYRSDLFQDEAKGKGGVIQSFSFRQAVPPGTYAAADYNYETPQQDLYSSEPSKVKLDQNSKLAHYEFPGKFEKSATGDLLAKVRMQEQEAARISGLGNGNCPAFTSGYRFALREFPFPVLNQEYVLLSVEHSASSGALGGEQESYECNFTCIPHTTPFRPSRVTPKPMMPGPQTAVVVGKPDEEIYTDKEGLSRVKIQFHWDRRGEFNDQSSCWVRVAQVMAGRGWGAQFIPRIGQEVIVDFLDGDPDRPLVIGVVYNNVEKPPYGSDATKSTLRTNSSKGGGGFNEIRFEDKKGHEQIFIHAQHDLDLRVGANQRETIGGSAHSRIGGTHNQEVGKSAYLKVGEKLVIDVGQEITLRVGDNFVKIDQGSVVIQGNIVYINTDGHTPGSIPEQPAAADKGTRPGSVDARPTKKIQ